MRASVSRLPGAEVSKASSHCLEIALGVLVVSCCFAIGCSSGTKRVAEAPPAPIAKAEEPTPKAPKSLPPELHQVQEAVKRVFKEAATIDSSQNPAFVAGDFNGDLSQDIAVILKPAPENLAEMNKEYPAWILRDPFGSPESRSPRLRVAATDVLLAVIHGYGANGWRDPQATQTYLLKKAVGSAMAARAGNEFVTANQGKKLPRLRGDLIGEVIDGKAGYLYYAEATYAWYDPKTFTGEPEPRRGHGAPNQRVKK